MRRKSGDNPVDSIAEAVREILRHVPSIVFHDEIGAIGFGQILTKNSSLIFLYPVLDDNIILRFGGRIRHMNIDEGLNTGDVPLDIHPYIIPNKII